MAKNKPKNFLPKTINTIISKSFNLKNNTIMHNILNTGTCLNNNGNISISPIHQNMITHNIGSKITSNSTAKVRMQQPLIIKKTTD